MRDMDAPRRPFLDRLQEPRVIVGVGGGAALLVAVVAVALLVSHRGGASVPDGASEGALQMEPGKTTPAGASAALRCFVGGQMVGEMPLDDCARRNGVSSQALDVGLPPPPPAPEAAPAAAPESGPEVADVERRSYAPLSRPTPGPISPSPQQVKADDDGGGDGRGQCLRYAGGGWRAAPGGAASLKACVHALYEGRCVRPGDGLYGRYGALTLRLVPGRVEIASDNRNFRPLVGQTQDCGIAD